MWYPAQTSMMVVHVALARFLENQGFLAAFEKYPYWYLGSTPFRYLTGPVLPGLLALLHRVLPGLSLFEIFFGLVGVFWLIGGVGVYKLISNLKSQISKNVAFLAMFFYLLGPLVPLMFRFSDGLSLMAFSLIPFTLLRYLKVLKRGNRKGEILLCSMLVFLLLLDISILPNLLLGMAAVFLATQGWKKAEVKIKKTLKLVAYCLLLVTIWYTPAYWWQVLLAPSFAGKPLFKVIGQVGQLLPIGLAIGLAVLSASKLKKKISLNTKYNILYTFTFYWLFIFGFLTLIRFISDWDFVLDWSVYYLEIQFGLGILGAIGMDRLLRKNQKPKTKNEKHPPDSLQTHLRRSGHGKPKDIKIFAFLICVFSFLFLIFYFIFNKYVLKGLQREIEESVEYKIGEFLSENVRNEERVFLSGSTVFWLNSFFEVVQVRGGSDLAAVHPTWDKVAWEIREGKDIDKSLRRLKEFKIKYLVVHAEDSREYYHDFVYPEKFEGVEELEKVYDREGDRIYRFNIKN